MTLEEDHKQHIKKAPNKGIYINLKRRYLDYLEEYLEAIGQSDKYFLFIPRNPIDDDRFKSHFFAGVYAFRTRRDEFDRRGPPDKGTTQYPVDRYVREYCRLVPIPLGYISPISDGEVGIFGMFFFAGVYAALKHKDEIKISMRSESGNLIEI